MEYDGWYVQYEMKAPIDFKLPELSTNKTIA
jgi:hypothetical protein